MIREPIAVPDTGSSDGLYTTLRAALLGFRDRDGRPLADAEYLEDRLYTVDPPDAPGSPYGIQTLAGLGGGGAYNAVRETPLWEIQLFVHDKKARPLLSRIADVIDAGLVGWKESRSGLIFVREWSRDDLPPYQDAASMRHPAIRIVVPLIVWPRRLTRVTAP